MTAWKLKFAWRPTKVARDRNIWLKLYYESTHNGAIYHREKGRGTIFKINMASVAY